MAYRYVNVGPREEENGPLFFKNLMGIMEDRRKNPETCLIVSVEDEDSSQNMDTFWSSPPLIQVIKYRCRVVRINTSDDPILFAQFNQIVNTEQFPTIYVFGPNSLEPTFTYNQIPNPFLFINDFRSLNCPQIGDRELDTAQPQYNLQADTYIPPPTIPQRSSSSPVKPKQQPIEENSANAPENPSPEPVNPPKREPSNAPENASPKPAKRSSSQPKIPKEPIKEENDDDEDDETDELLLQAKRRMEEKVQHRKQAQANKEPPKTVDITVKFPNGRTEMKTFMQTETVLVVNTWVIGLVDPGTRFKLVNDSTNEAFPSDPFTSLHTFAPAITLRIVPEKGGYKKARRSIFSYLSSWFSFLSDLSPFAPDNQDPADFWNPEPTAQPRGRRIGY